MKTDIIMQARMWSSRLPGKVLLSLAWRPVLWHDVTRCRLAKWVDDVIVATTTNREDDVIARWCEKNNVKFHRGSSDNVLERYYETAVAFKSEIVIRTTSDCPLVDPNIIDLMIEKYHSDDGEYHSISLNRKFVRGLDCEIMAFDILKKAYDNATEDYEKEHVTPYVINFCDSRSFVEPKEYAWDLRLTLDEMRDYELLSLIYDKFYKEWEIIEIKEVIKFLKENPEIAWMNQEVIHKKSNLLEK